MSMKIGCHPFLWGNQPAERKENKNYMEENKYRYADREEQLKKQTAFLCWASLYFTYS